MVKPHLEPRYITAEIYYISDNYRYRQNWKRKSCQRMHRREREGYCKS